MAQVKKITGNKRAAAADPMHYFFAEFRREHRTMRDLLLDLITSFIVRDMQKAATLLEEVDQLAGPHFMYEEKSLYPELVVFYGNQYISKLMTDHDLAIARASKLKSIIQKEQRTDEDYLEGINLVRAILPHISDCEGLTIMVEKLPEAKIRQIVSTRERALSENRSLLKWASTMRGRKLLSLQP